MGKIRTIALSTFKESIRNKVFYNLLFFALLMIGLSLVLANLTIGETLKIIKDFGLSSISLFGTLIAIFVGISLVYKEIDKKTIYTILSKPIARWQFLLGKYLGLILTLVVETAVMTFGLFFTCYLYHGIHVADLFMLKAIALIFVELMVVTAVALFFSSFSTPFLSGLFTMAVFVIGHCSGDLKVIAMNSESLFIKHLTNFIYYFLPNLENFNIKGKVVHNFPVSGDYLFFAICYGILYITVTLMLAMFIFQKRDFK